MSLFRANIWKQGFLKQAGSLLSVQHRTLPGVFFLATGVIALDWLKLASGYVEHAGWKMSWQALHKLQCDIEGIEQPVLLLSEISHIPLDPFNLLTTKERQHLLPLTEVAKATHSDTKARLAENSTKNDGLAFMKVVFGACLLFAVVTVIFLIISK